MSDLDLNVWEKAMGWRKRQMVKAQINEVSEKIRNDTIEEVAKEIEKMTMFGQDTTSSFAVYIRGMKR
jgi:hypothetical protein